MTRTPVASRPWEEMSRTGMRIMTPPEAMMKISSSRLTMNAATTRPRRAVSLMPFDALDASVLAAEVLELGPLAVAGVGDEQDRRVVTGDVTRHQLVVASRSFMPRTPAAVAAHRPHVALGEPDGHP